MVFTYQLPLLFLSDILQFMFQGALIIFYFNRKVDKKKLLIFSLVNAFSNEVPRLIFSQYHQIVYFAIYLVVLILSFKYLLGFRILQSTLATLSIFLVSTVVEYIVVSVFKVSFQAKYDAIYWATTYPNNIIIRNSANAIWLFSAILVSYFKFQIIIPEDLRKKRLLSIIIYIFFGAVLVVPNLLFFQNSISTVPSDVVVFNAASVLILVTLSIYNSIKFGELEVIKQEVEFQKQYNQTLNDVVDGLRGFKHDFNNMVQVIGGYLELNNIEGLKKYHKQMLGECRMINNILPLNSYVKDNPAIYGLLLSKLSYSELKDIIFEIKIYSEITIYNMKIYDFCKVLGVLLDNALEAAAESKKRFVELRIEEDDSTRTLNIFIDNTFSGVVETTQIFDNGYTTKKDHSGFGLWEVRKILSRHKNYALKTSVSENTFSQHIEITY